MHILWGVGGATHIRWGVKDLRGSSSITTEYTEGREELREREGQRANPTDSPPGVDTLTCFGALTRQRLQPKIRHPVGGSSGVGARW